MTPITFPEKIIDRKGTLISDTFTYSDACIINDTLYYRPGWKDLPGWIERGNGQAPYRDTYYWVADTSAGLIKDCIYWLERNGFTVKCRENIDGYIDRGNKGVEKTTYKFALEVSKSSTTRLHLHDALRVIYGVCHKKPYIIDFGEI